MYAQGLINECEFKAIRSSGAGGQHVNKVSSKIVLSFEIAKSEYLSEQEKERLFVNLKTRINKLGILSLACDESRNQHRNKEIVSERFLTILSAALYVPKSRRATRPTRASRIRKMKNKEIQSKKKSLRRKPNIDG